MAAVSLGEIASLEGTFVARSYLRGSAGFFLNYRARREFNAMPSERMPEVISSTPIFQGRVFNVKRDIVRFQEGREATLDIVEHPGSFGIAALPAPGEIVLVRQYRHAAGAYLWEIPAGTAEPGETPLEGAKRELAEETGYRCARIRELMPALYMTPGYCTERLAIYLAEDLTPGETSFDEDEDITIAVFSIAEARAMIQRNEILDAKTVMALQLLKM
jgi:ADP-ribose pyrophosphatase